MTPPPVLLVDDDALSLKLMKDSLEARGHAIELARTGPEALATVRRITPSVVVLDIGLPGLDGLSITRAIKAEPVLAGVAVLIVTAFAMAVDEERINASGCDGYLIKPLRLAEFVQTVERLLAR